mmetsp:Transcript_31917/g.70720  ORF Transcript_31917/g.70720 Transcript_31917/m.70720 type:complete len:93 (+) Transcript_31917:616-894(+)
MIQSATGIATMTNNVRMTVFNEPCLLCLLLLRRPRFGVVVAEEETSGSWMECGAGLFLTTMVIAANNFNWSLSAQITAPDSRPHRPECGADQ